MIIPLWPYRFRQQYGGTLPTTYCCLDTETTGFNADRDVIVEIGHCLVKDGKVDSELNLVLNWQNHRVVPDHWVRARLDHLNQEMANKGTPYHMTYARMGREGIAPEEGLTFYRNLLATLAEQDVPLVLHNALFDEEMLAHAFAGFIGAEDGFRYRDNGVFCTMGLEKANQRASDRNCLPRDGETLREYFTRARHFGGSKTPASLDRHCVPKYRLAEKHGLDMRHVHGALFDAKLVHYLFEEFRELAGKARQGLPPAPPPLVVPGGGTVLPNPFDGSSDRPPPTPASAQPARRRGQRNR